MEDVSIGFHDDFGNSFEFDSLRSFDAWVNDEQSRWDWLRDCPHTDSDGYADYLQRFNRIKEWISALKNEQISEQGFLRNLYDMYSGQKPQLLASDHWPGIVLNQIKEKFDLSDAELAFNILTGFVNIDLTDLRHFRVWQLLANPALVGTQAWAEEERKRISQSRSNFRRFTQESARLYDAELRKITGDSLKLFKRINRIAVNGAKLIRYRSENIESVSHDAISKINNTRLAYTEFMKLKAPVDYWDKKRSSHSDSSESWLYVLIFYIISSTILAFKVFENLLKFVGSGPIEARTFIITAGMGAFLTVLFWIARIIIKIYLGERHLASDAEERRVMTQAYLALINEDAASKEERSIILQALFRNAQDGIVRDEGSFDLSASAILANLLTSKSGKVG